MIKLLFILIFPTLTFGSVDTAWRIYQRSQGNVNSFPEISEELVNDGFYFSAVPFIKEFLAFGNKEKIIKIDFLIEKVTSIVGTRQFEVFPIEILKKLSTPTVKYILAKKYFRIGQYSEALAELNGTIPSKHIIKPYALMLEGSVHALMNNFQASEKAYGECYRLSKSFSRSGLDKTKVRQLQINQDYCSVGIARAQFSQGQYEKAKSSYLDLDKSSYIWPEILFEEAWNSFYLKNYNRTLGKLVTYRAPIMNFIFNPENDVLRTMSFMELCLFDDARKSVDDFYKKYENESKQLKKFLDKHGKNYRYYYLLIKTVLNNERKRGNSILDMMLSSIMRDATFQELKKSINYAGKEIKTVKSLPASNVKKLLLESLKDSIGLQKSLIGAYVRKSLHMFSYQLQNSFEDMSYIKLETLSRNRESILFDRDDKKKRGDVKYLKRTDKQYFWTFNGEFWADELGDYVFALKSECKI